MRLCVPYPFLHSVPPNLCPSPPPPAPRPTLPLLPPAHPFCSIELSPVRRGGTLKQSPSEEHHWIRYRQFCRPPSPPPDLSDFTQLPPSPSPSTVLPPKTRKRSSHHSQQTYISYVLKIVVKQIATKKQTSKHTNKQTAPNNSNTLTFFIIYSLSPREQHQKDGFNKQ